MTTAAVTRTYTEEARVRSAITRSADHRYTYEGVVYPGVTGILGVLDKSGPLMNWAARQTATAALEMLGPIRALDALVENVGKEGAIKALTSRSSWQRDEAAALGTDVHNLADMMVTGRPLPALTDTNRARVEHYARWWEASGWKLRLSEAMVVLPDPACGFGGTFDLLCYDRDGRTVLADIKTGKAVYHEAVLQMAAYGMAKLVQPASDGLLPGRVYPMPMPDRYAILHVTADEVREVEVAVGTPERMAFLACRELHEWRESMKGKRL
jgi:hypothetical protein